MSLPTPLVAPVAAVGPGLWAQAAARPRPAKESTHPSVFMDMHCLRRVDRCTRGTPAPCRGRRVTLHVRSPLAMPRKKLSTTIYITPEQNAQLKLLNEKTKVPVAEYIRQGIDLVLEKYRTHLPGQAAFEDL